MSFRAPNILPFTLTLQTGLDTYAIRLNSRRNVIRSMALYPDVHANGYARLHDSVNHRTISTPLPKISITELPVDVHAQLIAAYTTGPIVDPAVLALLKEIPTIQAPQTSTPAIAV